VVVLAGQLRLVQPDPDFRGPAEVVVQPPQLFDLDREPGIFQREPLDFPPARTMFF
jgi:hypothetical protein